MDRILARDKGRFLSIARQYAPAGEAVDLYQQILYRLWKGLDGFEGRSEPMTWAYLIALNTARAYRRDNLRRDRAWRAYAQSVQSGQRGGRGEEEILREFAQSLPDTERTLLSLYLTNLSWREFAELAGIPEAILRVKISRLKSQFERQYL